MYSVNIVGYKGIIQVKFNRQYSEVSKAFLVKYLTEIFEKEVNTKDIIKDFDIAIEDTKLRNGIYDYA